MLPKVKYVNMYIKHHHHMAVGKVYICCKALTSVEEL